MTAPSGLALLGHLPRFAGEDAGQALGQHPELGAGVLLGFPAVEQGDQFGAAVDVPRQIDFSELLAGVGWLA